MCQAVNALERPAGAESIRHVEKPVGAGRLQLIRQLVARLVGQRLRQARGQTIQPRFQPAQRLLQRLLEGAPDGHHLAHGLHLGREAIVRGRELLESEAWDLRDHVVDRRLERGGRPASGDVVLQLIERVANSELRGDLRDREAGGLRGERRRAGHARIHLDDEQAAIFRIHGELHVGAARVHADLAQNRDGGIAHALVFLVGERQGRRHRDGIARMHAHRIEVLDGADNDAIVLVVADHFHLELFPTDHRLFDQHLFGGRGLESAGHDRFELFTVVGDTAAGAAHRERRTDDDRIAVLGGDGVRLFETARDLRFRTLEADLAHRVPEQLAVFGHVDGGARGGDELHAVLLEYAFAHEVECGVECCLATHRGQQGVGLFLLDDPRDGLPVDRLDVDGIRHLRVRHDRGGIGVHQDDAVALLAERLARLGAGVIELTGLPDNDGAGADDQDALDVSSFGHSRDAHYLRAFSSASFSCI